MAEEQSWNCCPGCGWPLPNLNVAPTVFRKVNEMAEEQSWNCCPGCRKPCDYFIAGYCPECAADRIKQLEQENIKSRKDLVTANHDIKELMRCVADYKRENKKQAKIIEAFTAYKNFIKSLTKKTK